MSYLGIGFYEKEGIIQYIEPMDDEQFGKIRIVIQSYGAEGKTNKHAMLNIEDDTFVSDERFHSIISTYEELSSHLHQIVNNENKECFYNTSMKFSRYAKAVFTTLQEVYRKAGVSRLPRSETINNKTLRVDYNWLYISGLELDGNEEQNAIYSNKIIDYIKNNLGTKYKIGNFTTNAMRLTRMTEKESMILERMMERSKRGYWKIHSSQKLCFQNQYHKLSNYQFEYNYKIIGDRAFENFYRIEYFSLPPSVEYIGRGAFSLCDKMQRILLPKGLLDIGQYAFSDCTLLNHVIIPDTVEEIGSYAFRGCESLTIIVMPDNLKYIGRHVFDGCSNALKIYINENNNRIMKLLDEYKDKIICIDELSLKLMKARME